MTDSTSRAFALSANHVGIGVSNLERSIAFYRDILGFDVMQRYGDQAAFISAGGYHHHLGLNTWESRGGSAPLTTGRTDGTCIGASTAGSVTVNFAPRPTPSLCAVTVPPWSSARSASRRRA